MHVSVLSCHAQKTCFKTSRISQITSRQSRLSSSCPSRRAPHVRVYASISELFFFSWPSQHCIEITTRTLSLEQQFPWTVALGFQQKKRVDYCLPTAPGPSLPWSLRLWQFRELFRSHTEQWHPKLCRSMRRAEVPRHWVQPRTLWNLGTAWRHRSNCKPSWFGMFASPWDSSYSQRFFFLQVRSHDLTPQWDCRCCCYLGTFPVQRR